MVDMREVQKEMEDTRLRPETIKQLDELAAEMGRTHSFLIEQAVQEFVEREFAFLSAVREGEADVKAGRTLSHEEVSRWVEELKAKSAPDRRNSG